MLKWLIVYLFGGEYFVTSETPFESAQLAAEDAKLLSDESWLPKFGVFIIGYHDVNFVVKPRSVTATSVYAVDSNGVADLEKDLGTKMFVLI